MTDASKETSGPVGPKTLPGIIPGAMPAYFRDVLPREVAERYAVLEDILKEGVQHAE